MLFGALKARVSDHDSVRARILIARTMLRDALALMEEADVDLLPVVDGVVVVGVVTTAEILKLDEILNQTNPEP